jgi:hypothetical protein
MPDSVAEGVGFEPTSDFRRCRFSKPVPSTGFFLTLLGHSA